MQPAPNDPFLASKVTFWETNGHITRQVLIPYCPLIPRQRWRGTSSLSLPKTRLGGFARSSPDFASRRSVDFCREIPYANPSS